MNYYRSKRNRFRTRAHIMAACGGLALAAVFVLSYFGNDLAFFPAAASIWCFYWMGRNFDLARHCGICRAVSKKGGKQ